MERTGTWEFSGKVKFPRLEKTLDQAGDELLEMLFRTDNGRLTAAEVLGHREFIIAKLYRSA